MLSPVIMSKCQPSTACHNLKDWLDCYSVCLMLHNLTDADTVRDRLHMSHELFIVIIPYLHCGVK